MKKAEAEKKIRDIIADNVGGVYDNRQKCADQIMELFGYVEPKTENPIKESEETLSLDSTEIIGSVQQRFKELEHKNWNWQSFYNGWIEGRVNLIKENKGL